MHTYTYWLQRFVVKKQKAQNKKNTSKRSIRIFFAQKSTKSEWPSETSNVWRCRKEKQDPTAVVSLELEFSGPLYFNNLLLIIN